MRGAMIEVRLWPVVQYHHEDGGHWADSPDFPGWLAAADTQEELEVLVREAQEITFAPAGWPKLKEGGSS